MSACDDDGGRGADVLKPDAHEGAHSFEGASRITSGHSLQTAQAAAEWHFTVTEMHLVEEPAVEQDRHQHHYEQIQFHGSQSHEPELYLARSCGL